MPLAYGYAHGGNGALDAGVGQLDRGWQHKPGAAYAERVGDRARPWGWRTRGHRAGQAAAPQSSGWEAKCPLSSMTSTLATPRRGTG